MDSAYQSPWGFWLVPVPVGTWALAGPTSPGPTSKNKSEASGWFCGSLLPWQPFSEASLLAGLPRLAAGLSASPLVPAPLPASPLSCLPWCGEQVWGVGGTGRREDLGSPDRTQWFECETQAGLACVEAVW